MSNLFPSMNFHVRLGHEILHPSVRSWIGCETRYLPLLTARHGALKHKFMKIFNMGITGSLQSNVEYGLLKHTY